MLAANKLLLNHFLLQYCMLCDEHKLHRIVQTLQGASCHAGQIVRWVHVPFGSESSITDLARK